VGSEGVICEEEQEKRAKSLFYIVLGPGRSERDNSERMIAPPREAIPAVRKVDTRRPHCLQINLDSFLV
jgi:hypothetical protein